MIALGEERVKVAQDDLARMRKLFRKGASWSEIARRTGYSYEIVRRRLDPAYAAMRRDRKRKWRTGNGVAALDPKKATRAGVSSDAHKLMNMVPRDTRDLTGRVFGDPLPGRSALDMRSE